MTGGGSRSMAPMTGKPLHEFATRVGDRLPEPGDAVVRRDRLRLRGGRARTDEPRPCRRARRSPGRTRRSRPWHRARWRSASRGGCRAGRPSSSSSPRCWRCDRRTSCSTSRRRSSIRRGTRSSARRSAAGADRHGAARRRAQDRPARGAVRPVVVIDGGRIVIEGPRGRVLADPRLEAWASSRRPPSGSSARSRRAASIPPWSRRMTTVAFEASVSSIRTGRARSPASTSTSRPASASRSSARTAAASRRSSASWTGCFARPRAGPPRRRRLATQRVAELAATVGIVFQNPDRQIFAGQVGAEVEFGPRILGRSRQERGGGGRGGLEPVGLRGIERPNPYDLGYSRRKLLALASVLAMGTPVVVLDEPTTGRTRAAWHGPARRATGRRDAPSSRSATTCASSPKHSSASSSWRAGRVVLDGTPARRFGEEAGPRWRPPIFEPPLAARMGARLGLGPTPT